MEIVNFEELSQNPDTIVEKMLEISKVKSEDTKAFVSGILATVKGLQKVLDNNLMYDEYDPLVKLLNTIEKDCKKIGE